MFLWRCIIITLAVQYSEQMLPEPPGKHDVVVDDVPIDKIAHHSYQNFRLEHEVTEKKAGIAYRAQMHNLLNKNVDHVCRGVCTESIHSYCLSPSFLNDHCCCTHLHKNDDIPWLAHTCYMKDDSEVCRASIGSCLRYLDVKSCCCDYALAVKWKSTYASASNYSASVILTISALMVTITAILL